MIGKGRRLKNDAALNYRILKKCKYPIRELDADHPLPGDKVRKASVVVDAIFGVGLNREVSGLFCEAIEVLNTHAKKIIAVDIPSGLDGTTGKIYGICIKAKTTVTFSFAKKGFTVNQGPKQTGKVIVADIGIPVQLVNKIL